MNYRGVRRKGDTRDFWSAPAKRGKAQRRRRFDCAGTPGRASQSGVALRLPPHSKIAGAATECSPTHGPLSIMIRPKERTQDQEPQRGTKSTKALFLCLLRLFVAIFISSNCGAG